MAQIESELSRVAVYIRGTLASSLQPEERIASLAYTLLSSKVCTKPSYRDAVQTLNLFLHRKEEDSIKLRTLADSMERLGGKIAGWPVLQTTINGINASREEKITFTAEELDIGQTGPDCVYVSIDDIGVKHQKDSSNAEFVKKIKYIENTVAHIRHGTDTYVLTGIGMESVMKSALAFLFFNGLLQNELVFFADGAGNIKSNIEHFFPSLYL